jgi:hypothetical protein
MQSKDNNRVLTRMGARKLSQKELDGDRAALFQRA